MKTKPEEEKAEKSRRSNAEEKTERASAKKKAGPKRSKKLIAGVCVLAVLLVGEIGFFAYLLVGHGEELISLIAEPAPEPTPTPDPYPENTKLEATMNTILAEDGVTVMLGYCMGDAKKMDDAGQKADMYKRCARITDKYLKDNADLKEEDRAYLGRRVLSCIYYAEAASPSSAIERSIAMYEEAYGDEYAKREIVYYSALADARDEGVENPEKMAQEAVQKALGTSGRGGGK